MVICVKLDIKGAVTHFNQTFQARRLFAEGGFSEMGGVANWGGGGMAYFLLLKVFHLICGLSLFPVVIKNLSAIAIL